MKKIWIWVTLGAAALITLLVFAVKGQAAQGETTPATSPKMQPTGTPGTKRGERNNNPCNLQPLPGGQKWDGQTGVDDAGYATFADPVKGIRAAGVNALNYYFKDGITNLNGFSRWGPQGNTDYGSNLATTIGIDEYRTFDVPNNLESLLKAISINENSEVPYDEPTWKEGTRQALATKGLG